MAGLKARLLGGWIGDRILRDAVVTSVAAIGDRFRHVTVEGGSLVHAPFSPGDKVQVYLPDVGARTYTPFAFEPSAGRFQLLAYLHGSGPGSVWARGLAAGHRVRVLGPRSSLPLRDLVGPIGLFGDETSIALARATRDAYPGRDVRARIEVSSIVEASKAMEALGLDAEWLIAREPARAHLSRVARELVGAAAGGAFVLTGDAYAIQDLRGKLRALSAKPAQTRAYWAAGKAGLD